ncbi:MAG TPA: hypothetical protein DCM68_02585, partial [Verrucomicrobia bacterium]|nr:hypothetical protein [Verrucomicrobiota bacterium]
MRLRVFATHPIQYQVPVWRALAADGRLALTVHYFSDHSVRGGADSGFGQNVAWDVPMLEGYAHCFESRTAATGRFWACRFGWRRLYRLLRDVDGVLIHGYCGFFEWQTVLVARLLGRRVIMRGDFTDVSHSRSWLLNVLRDIVLQGIYSQVSAFAVVGKNAESHLRRLGVPAQKLYASPFNVDWDLFEAQKAKVDRTSARAALGLTERNFAVVF